jgi:hypothetical protein
MSIFVFQLEFKREKGSFSPISTPYLMIQSRNPTEGEELKKCLPGYSAVLTFSKLSSWGKVESRTNLMTPYTC